MGFLDRLFGSTGTSPNAPGTVDAVESGADDRRAIDRYRFVLRSAPPETIEQVHAEAFARLTDAQRTIIYEELSKGAGTGERPLSSEPATLARSAIRAENRTPGAMERVVSAGGSSLLGTVAGYVVGSALVSGFLPWGDTAGQDTGSAADSGDWTASEVGDLGF